MARQGEALNTLAQQLGETKAQVGGGGDGWEGCTASCLLNDVV